MKSSSVRHVKNFRFRLIKHVRHHSTKLYSDLVNLKHQSIPSTYPLPGSFLTFVRVLTQVFITLICSLFILNKNAVLARRLKQFAIRNDALLRDAKSVACFSVRVRGLANAITFCNGDLTPTQNVLPFLGRGLKPPKFVKQ